MQLRFFRPPDTTYYSRLSAIIFYPIAFIYYLFLLIFTAAFFNISEAGNQHSNYNVMTNKSDSLHYLALGDSYTIGESVPLTENFPYQAVQILRQNGYNVAAPDIIAKTGWTTDELQSAINRYHFRPKYDFVTLLIGVNNQYRGRPVKEYEPEFEHLLKQAIAFADNKPEKVAILSIPDWGITPFAEGRDSHQIAIEIDAYNAANEAIAAKYKVKYINITPWTREAANDPSLLAADGLHPSATEYKRWAQEVAAWAAKLF